MGGALVGGGFAGAEVVHRLGVLLWLVTAGSWAVLAALAARRERRASRRLDRLMGIPGKAGAGRRARRAEAGRALLRAWVPVPSAVIAGYVLVGGATGWVVGGFAGAGVWWWRRRRGRAERTGSGADSEAVGGGAVSIDAVEAGRQLPLAADLLAACIAAGAGPVAAAQAVGESLGGPVGRRLARTAVEVRLGGDPEEAWRRVGVMPGAEPLARCLERAGASGAPAAEPVARIAAACRAEWARTATARARRAAVVITAPVGLCFLPGFLALGVLPVVIGLAGELLGGR